MRFHSRFINLIRCLRFHYVIICFHMSIASHAGFQTGMQFRFQFSFIGSNDDIASIISDMTAIGMLMTR